MIDSTQGQEAGGLIDPRGHALSTLQEHGTTHPNDSVMIVNDTGLPDSFVQEKVTDHFVESASLAWGKETTFQTYAQQGSMLARSGYRTPANVIDEIKLARELAEKDDDVAAVLGQMVAVAFGEGMENHHTDEKTAAIFNAMCEDAGMDLVLQELYRELLISSQINVATLFTRTMLEYSLSGSEVINSESIASPLVGVLPAENIRIIGNDMFRTGILAYSPDNAKLREWLEKYFAPSTSAAEKAKMGREDRVSANMFTGAVPLSAAEQLSTDELPAWGGQLYTLNPRMVARTSFPKGARKYPRPLLTRDFALLEAKRLLNIMDYALLQGGSNYIVVAKKGSDQLPADPGEVTNLTNVVRQASKTGVIVGDHRLTFEVITPELKELLNPEKRRMLGRKIVMALLRLSEHGHEEGGAEGIKADDEMVSRVISSDRRIVQRLVEQAVYKEAAKRNPSAIKSKASVWFPKIVLQGQNFFTEYVLKLRDRGDIPRSWAVSAAGFDWSAGVEERKRELASGEDEIMVPGEVPHSSPESGPQDNNEGRPKGAKTGGENPDAAKPKRTLQKNSGETIKAWYEKDVEQLVRMGDTTYAILEEYPDRVIGRVTSTERDVMEAARIERRGPTLFVPVNEGYDTRDEKAVRLADGISMIVGNRTTDGAIVAKLLCFREPNFTDQQAEELAFRWGFLTTAIPRIDAPPPSPVDPEEHGAAPAPIELHVHTDNKAKKMRLLRNEAGDIIGSEPIEDDEPGDD